MSPLRDAKICLSFLFLLWGTILFADEPPLLTRLNQSGATVGQNLTIQAVGTFKSWPVQVWCSQPEVTWSCLEEVGKFQVNVPATCKTGPVWVRFYNAAGTTPARQFLLSHAPQRMEIEPNNLVNEANPIKIEEVVHGVLEKNVDVDLFKLSLNAGEPFSARLEAHRIGSPMDGHIQLLDGRGFVVAENMDCYGLDPGLFLSIPTTGDYLLRIFAFPSEPDSAISFRGGADWCYRLHCSRSQLPYESEVEPDLTQPPEFVVGESIEQAVILDSPKFGIISKANSVHYFRLPASYGKTIELRLIAQSMGSSLDPTLAVIDKEGKQQSFQDDNSTSRDPQIVWQAPDQGEYFAVVSDFHKQASSKHAYWLITRELVPEPRLSISSDSIQGKAGQAIELSFQITRVANWEGEIDLNYEGLQEGVSIEPNRLKVDKNTTQALVKFILPKSFQGVLPLSLRAVGQTNTTPIVGPTKAGVWLTVE